MPKISDLTAISSLGGTEEFVVAQSGTTRKIAASDLSTEVLAGAVAADVAITDSGAYYTSTDVEGALQEIGSGSVGGGPGGGVDPVADALGTPDTAFEFNTNSLTGLTAIGSPDVEDADTTIPDHYFIRDDDNSACGRYVSVSAPFTVVTKMTDKTLVATDGYKAGVFIGDSLPGFSSDVDWWLIGNTSYGVWLELAAASNIFNEALPAYAGGPFYMAIRVNSTSDVDYLLSTSGYVWKKMVDSRNPSGSFTVATCGLAINGNGGIMAAAFDYLRIWNSAKTFPGAVA